MMVAVVTNRNPDGKGSFYDALLSAQNWGGLIRFEVSGHVPVPEARFQLQDTVIDGCDAPGTVILTGNPLRISNARDLTLQGLKFRLGLPASEEQGNTWGPLRISSDPGYVMNRINIFGCSVLGGTDKSYIGPEDLKQHDPEKPCATDVRIVNSNFFYPFRQLSGTEGRHNFNLMLYAVDRCLITKCTFAHGNRRNPQIYGWNVRFSSNVVYNYGSMGLGAMGGSMDIVDNLFLPGCNTPSDIPPIIADTMNRDGKPFVRPLSVYMVGNLLLGGPGQKAVDFVAIKDEAATPYSLRSQPLTWARRFESCPRPQGGLDSVLDAHVSDAAIGICRKKQRPQWAWHPEEIGSPEAIEATSKVGV